MMPFNLGRAAIAAAFASALFIYAAPVALAQGAAAPAAPAQPAAPVAELTPAHVALATEVVTLSGMSRSTDLIVPQMVDRARQLFTQMRPELAGEIDKSIQALKPEFDKESAEALKIAATAFAHRLSMPELQEMKAFFSSSVGKKFVESQPAIINEMFRSIDAFSVTLSQTVVDKLREDMKKKGHSL